MASQPNDVQPITGLKKDKLSRGQLRDLYEMTFEKLRVDESIFSLFQEAIKGGWDKAKWDVEMEKLPWYQDNKASVREYLMLAANPDSADFKQKQADAAENVRRRVMTLGVNLSPEEQAILSKQTLMEGWGAPEQAYLLDQAILASPQTGDYGGDVAKNATALKAIAQANGVYYDDSYFDSAGVSIASRATESSYWETKIREVAASQLPVFKDQIMLGLNANAIAAPYLKSMADTLELNVNDLDVNDPTILGALSGYDSKGNPYAMNLGEFKRSLRKDKRWMDTTDAQNSITNAASGVLKMFGISN